MGWKFGFSFSWKVAVWLPCLLLTGCGMGKATIHGQVFIVTKAHQSVKLGLVTVALYPDDVLRRHVAIKKNAADKWMQSFERARTAVEAAHSSLETTDEQMKRATEVWDSLMAIVPPFSGESYLDGLPEPLARVQTDADGEFTLDVPRNGKHVLVAHPEAELKSADL